MRDNDRFKEWSRLDETSGVGASEGSSGALPRSVPVVLCRCGKEVPACGVCGFGWAQQAALAEQQLNAQEGAALVDSPGPEQIPLGPTQLGQEGANSDKPQPTKVLQPTPPFPIVTEAQMTSTLKRLMDEQRLELSEEQQQLIMKLCGPQSFFSVEACPGAGKTKVATVLLRAVADQCSAMDKPFLHVFVTPTRALRDSVAEELNQVFREQEVMILGTVANYEDGETAFYNKDPS